MKIRTTLFLMLITAAVLTSAQDSGSSAKSSSTVPPPLGGTGTPDHITKWLTTTSIGNSGIFENGVGNVGVGTTTPTTKFDVKGAGDYRDTLTLFPTGTHPTLSVAGTAFRVSSTGKVTFVAGQTFPGVGTVSTVNSGAGLTGGPIHTTGTLSVNPAVVPFLANANAFTQNQTILGNLFVDIVFGTGVSLNGSAPTFMGAGANLTAGLGGNPLTVTGGSSATNSTDTAGGDLILQAGDGNGAGGSGAVRIQAAAAGPSGTTADTLVDRQVFAPKSAPMGGQTGNANIFLLTLNNGDGAGATVRFTIRANDGASNYAAETGTCVIAAAAAPDGSQSGAALQFGADATDFGVVNASCDFINGTGISWGISVSDSLNFVPTTHDIYFEIDNVSGSALTTLLPGAKVRKRLNQRVDALHPKRAVRRSN